jgi:hypothetical protein
MPSPPSADKLRRGMILYDLSHFCQWHPIGRLPACRQAGAQCDKFSFLRSLLVLNFFPHLRFEFEMFVGGDAEFLAERG